MLAIIPPAGSCHISHRQNSQISFPPLIYAPYCKPQPALSVDISFFPAVYYTSVCANFLGKGGYGMSVKAQVLSALDAARGRYISGQELADQLGVNTDDPAAVSGFVAKNIGNKDEIQDIAAMYQAGEISESQAKSMLKDIVNV